MSNKGRLKKYTATVAQDVTKTSIVEVEAKSAYEAKLLIRKLIQENNDSFVWKENGKILNPRVCGLRAKKLGSEIEQRSDDVMSESEGEEFINGLTWNGDK